MDPIDDLLQQLLERPEGEWEHAVAEVCTQQPELGPELRRRFAVLHRSGFAASTPAAPAFPDRLGEFTLVRCLGQGGMGVVYEARQERLGRTVALKLVRPEQLYFPGARERFRREIEAVARLSHPGIVSVFTVGEENGVPFFAMELVQGASLDVVLQELSGRAPEKLTGADLAAVVAQKAQVDAAGLRGGVFAGTWTEVCLAIGKLLAEALAHAHARGVVHRDVKPSNVVITAEGRAVLLDFGLALPPGVDRMTRQGTEVGSVPYMAPEQLRGETGDARADVYGLGVTLRELLALRHPFLAPTREMTRRRIERGDAQPLQAVNHAVSWELATVCATATALQPKERYQTAVELARDLLNVIERRPIMARPAGTGRRLVRWAQRRPAVATGLLLGLFVAVGTPTAIAIGIAQQRDRARAAEAEEQRKSYEANLAAANAALAANDAREARVRLLACPEDKRGFEWHHLDLALDGSLAVLRGHAGEVTAVEMSPDAQVLASGGSDGDVRLWDLGRGELLHRFPHHTGAPIASLVFAADGSRLWIADAKGHASVVDPGNRAVLAEHRTASRKERVWLGIDGRAVLVDKGGWHFLSLDPATLSPQREIRLQQLGHAPHGTLATDGRWLCSASFGRLQTWDLQSGQRIADAPMPRSEADGVVAMTMSCAGERVALSDAKGRITVHRVADGTLVQVLADCGAAAAIVFDRRGELLAAAGTDGGLRVFEVASGVSLSILPGHEGPANAAAFAAAGTLVATAGADGYIRLWSPFGGRDVRVLQGHAGTIRDLAVIPDGSRLLSVAEDGHLRVWDTANGLPLRVLGGYAHHINAMVIAPDGRRAFSTFHDSVVTTDLVELAQIETWCTGEGAAILDLAVDATGKTLLAAHANGTLAQYEPTSRRVVRKLHGHDGPVRACAFSPDASLAYSGGVDRKLLRWSLAEQAAPTTLLVAPLPIQAIALSRDGRTLTVAESALRSDGAPRDEGAVQRLADDGTLLWERRCSSPVRSLAVLPDEMRVVTGHLNGTLTIWDAAAGVPLLVRQIATNAVRALAADPTGHFVAAGDSGRGRVRLIAATRSIAASDVHTLAAAAAAMHWHAALHSGLHTPDEILAMFAARSDLDPEQRRMLETCKLCSLITWDVIVRALEVCEVPGLPAERYEQARRLGEAYPGGPLTAAIVMMACVRLGEMERALTVAEELEKTRQPPDYELDLRAARALALHRLGRREEAAAELARLQELAAAESAEPIAVALWREVAAVLAN